MEANIKEKSINITTIDCPTVKTFIRYSDKFTRSYNINYNRGKEKAKDRSKRWD